MATTFLTQLKRIEKNVAFELARAARDDAGAHATAHEHLADAGDGLCATSAALERAEDAFDGAVTDLKHAHLRARVVVFRVHVEMKEACRASPAWLLPAFPEGTAPFLAVLPTQRAAWMARLAGRVRSAVAPPWRDQAEAWASRIDAARAPLDGGFEALVAGANRGDTERASAARAVFALIRGIQGYRRALAARGRNGGSARRLERLVTARLLLLAA